MGDRQSVLFVVPSHGFRDEELMAPLRVLEAAGLRSFIAAPRRTRLQGAGGAQVRADEDLDEVSVLSFAAVVVVGGSGARDELWGNPALLHLLQRAGAEGQLIVGIGLGVVPLAQAELLEGQHAVCDADDAAIAELERHGATRVPGDLVDEGGRVITARGSDAARELGRRIAERLRG